MKLRKANIPVMLLLLILAGCHGDRQRTALPEQPVHSKGLPLKEKDLSPAVQENPILSRFEDQVFLPGQASSHSGNINEEYYIPVTGMKSIGKRRGQVYGPSSRAKDEIPRKSVTMEDISFFTRGKTSDGIYITLSFDNDIFNYTDYYYTAGQSITVIHPLISASPLTRLLPGLRESINYYGISLVQNLYTPLKLDKDVILVGDRPFAAYLCLSHDKTSLSSKNSMRMESSLALGTMGPASLGKYIQDIIHTDEPVGWVNQVANEFIINYSIRFEKGVYRKDHCDFAVYAGAEAGTLYDNIKAGLFFQAGKTTGRYENLFQTTPREPLFKNRVRYYFNLDLENKLVAYDATLQGGMVNRESIYVIPGEAVKRYVFTGNLGLGIGLGPYSLEVEQVFLTPEFEGGKHHFWLRIKNTVRIN